MLTVVIYDRASFEYLSGESLWTSKEAVYFATNYAMKKLNHCDDDYWWGKYNDIFVYYDRLLLELCDNGKLTAYTELGRKGRVLDKNEYTELQAVNDKYGEAADSISVFRHGSVYFYKKELLEALKEYNVRADGNNLWASFEKKDKALRPEQETKLIVQGIGIALWAADPTMTITKVANHELVMKHGGSNFAEKTRKSWLSEVNDRSPDQKTGPKPKDP